MTLSLLSYEGAEGEKGGEGGRRRVNGEKKIIEL